MWEFYELFRLVAASQLFLAILLLIVKHDREWTASLAILLFIAIEAYLLAPIAYNHFDYLVPILFIRWLSNLLPLFLWLLARALFRDEKAFARSHYIISGVAFCYLSAVAWLRSLGIVEEAEHLWSTHGILVEFIPQVLKLTLALFAIAETARGFNADLVEKRRQLRVGVLAVVGIYCLAIISVELFYRDDVPIFLETLHAIGLVLIISLVCVFIFTLEAVLFSKDSNTFSAEIEEHSNADVEPTEAPDPDLQILEDLRHQLEKHSVYKETGLTIRLLAERLAHPEYKLRQVINGQLGYRNFNEFLNHYRIDEASRRLRDPQEAKLPILTIALDVGYGSLSTFNKAFRATHGMTPSEFRKNHTDEFL